VRLIAGRHGSLTLLKSEFVALSKNHTHLLSGIVAHLQDAVLLLDDENRVLFANPSFTKLYGYKPDSVLGQHADILLAPKDRGKSGSWQLTSGTDAEHICEDGSGIYISEHISLMPDAASGGQVKLVQLRDISERIVIENTLAATEVRLDAVLSSIDDVVYSMDSRTRDILYVNKATRLVFDMNEEDFRNKTVSWKKMVHGGDLHKLEMATHELRKKGYAEAEYRLITPKGDIKWLRDRAWVVSDPQNPRIDGIITDVTERKLAEQAYRDSEERYRTAIQSSVEAIYMMNPATYAITDVNEAFCRLLGYTRDEALNLKMADFVDHSMQDITAYIDRVIEDGESVLDRRTWRCKDGMRLTVEITANRIVQRDQEIIFVVARDVTTQMEIKKQLDSERELLGEVVNNAPVPMAILDHDLRFVVYSKTWVQSYGPGRIKLTGKKLFEIYQKLPSHWQDLCYRGLQGEVLHIAEEELRLDEHNVIYLRLAIHPWGNEDGSRNGVILVAERIDELVSARKAAEDANQAKSAFLARITHELRTPLNAILGYAQIMTNDPTVSEVHRGYVDNMYRSGNHLLTMINDILDISKIEASRMELQNEPSDLHEIIRDVVEMFRLKAASKGVDLRVSVDPEINPAVQIDQSKFSQVLINLIGNAVKFTDQGHVSVRFSLTDNTSTGTRDQLISVEVEDTGRGIPEDDLHLVFEPFQQAKNSDIKGTGLGLAITKRIVNLMGGDVTVRSVLGQGALFGFAVPMQIVEHPTGKKADKFTRVKTIASPRPFRVLVVDDVDLNRTVVRLLLERVGASISEAADGQQAVDLFSRQEFDVVIMDIIMPVMDGVKAMSLIRKMPRGKTVAVIALTASGFDDKRDALIKAGFTDYILKPFKEPDLLRSLHVNAGVTFEYKEVLSDGGDISVPEDDTTALVRHVLALPEELRQIITDLLVIQDVDGLSDFADNHLGEGQYEALKVLIDKVVRDFDLFLMSNVAKRLLNA